MTEMLLMCARCDTTENVSLENSRTCHVAREEEPNPNAPIPLCPSCAKEHHEYWDEMWADYYRGRI